MMTVDVWSICKFCLSKTLCLTRWKLWKQAYLTDLLCCQCHRVAAKMSNDRSQVPSTVSGSLMHVCHYFIHCAIICRKHTVCWMNPMMSNGCTTVNTTETNTTEQTVQKSFCFGQLLIKKEIFNSKLYRNWKPMKGNSFMIRDLGDLIFSVDLSSRVVWTVRGKVCSTKREEIVRFSRNNLVLRI